jgi:hypothetical protein
MRRIELSENERRLLLKLVQDTLEATRYPLSPDADRLRALVDKLRGEENPKARG